MARHAAELIDLVGHSEAQEKTGARTGHSETGRDFEGRAVRQCPGARGICE